jgi:Zn-dependent peptidase ImmA (M78 family)
MDCQEAFVCDIIDGTKKIDDNVAEKLSAVLGGTPAFWSNRQIAFEKQIKDVSACIPKAVAKEWLRELPLADMYKLNWLSRGVDNSDKVVQALNFFDVLSISEWRSTYASFTSSFSFRTSTRIESRIGSLAAWLRRAEMEARNISRATWDAESFKERLADIRRLTKAKSPAYFIPRLRALCAASGVAVVFVRTPAGCRASGATRFISESQPLIVLSFRHLTDDHFWFTFFHEAGHILLHGEGNTFIDGVEVDSSRMETEANRFAASCLIPLDRQSELMNIEPRTTSILRFATAIGVSPGIVVGQMQHHNVVGHHMFNRLKRKFTWEEITQASR